MSTAFGCCFVVIGLVIVAAGIYNLTEAHQTEYMVGTCELVTESGPHYHECESADDDMDHGSGVGVRRLRVEFAQCGSYTCDYKALSNLTGDRVFEELGRAVSSRCTEFPSATNGEARLTGCYVRIKDGQAVGLSFQPKHDDITKAYVIIGFGCVFSGFSLCWTCCWVAMSDECATSAPRVVQVENATSGLSVFTEPKEKMVDCTCAAEAVDYIVTCESTDGFVKCTNIAGIELAKFKVPTGQGPYGPWFVDEVHKDLRTTERRLCLLNPAGEVIWREPLERKESTLVEQTFVKQTCVEPFSVKPTFIQENGYISKGGDISMARMTIADAKQKALTTPGCRGFCFRGGMTDEVVEILFKNKWDNHVGANSWTSFRLMLEVKQGSDGGHSMNSSDEIPV